MISIRLNSRPSKQTGFATLAITVIVLLAISIISFFTARAVITDQQSTSNVYRAQQAFDAAQSGLDYGITYLEENRSSVTDGMTVNGTLSNSSTYAITYEFQGGTNELVKIISVGTNADGTATRTVEQLVKYAGASTGSVTVPLQVRGQLALSGNAVIKNLESDTTVITGDPAVTIIGGASTELASGTSSTSGNIQADIQENNTTLAGMSDNELEQQTLGTSITNLASTATVTGSGSGMTNYNSLVDGATGATIYITQSSGTAVLNSGTTVGTAENPVNIIVSGDINIVGNVIVYGNVIATGAVSVSGNANVNGLVFALGDVSVSTIGAGTGVQGAIVSGGLFSVSGNAEVNYDSTILENTLTILGSYGKVPGSWKDI